MAAKAEKTWDEARIEIVTANEGDAATQNIFVPDDAPGPPTHITAAELARVKKVSGRLQQATDALQRAAAAAAEARGQWALVAEEIAEAYGQIQINDEDGEILRPEAGQ